jgi:predicted dehydrogenase
MAVRAVGARGTIVIDGGRPAAFVHGGAPAGDRARVLAGGDSAGLVELVDDFVAHLDGAAPPLQTGPQGCEVVRVLLAAYDSIAAGGPVELDPSGRGSR